MANKEFVVRHGLIVANGIISSNATTVGINTFSAAVTLHVASNDAIQMPVGNTAQRPSASNGMIRYNGQTSKAEIYASGAWVNVVDNRIFVNVGGIATGGGNLSSNVTITVPEANTLEYFTAASDKAIAPDVMWDSANAVSLSDGANIAVNFSSGYNFTVTLGGNRNLDNPSNVKNGQCGIITINQDGTGSRTLSFSSNWKFAGGVDPTLTTTASAVDVLSYYAVNSTFIYAVVANDVK